MISEIPESTLVEMRELASRYPNPRSALLPMLHLVQSVQDQITTEGIASCADVLGITQAEATAVATFYTMYKFNAVGKHHIGVCTNTLCGLLGGDAVYDKIAERLGASHNGPSADGNFWLERIECQAACTHAPVMTVDWEFMDDVTPESALDIIDRLAAGDEVWSTRGPKIRDFQATERSIGLASPDLATEGNSVDAKMLAGLMAAREQKGLDN